MHNYKRLSVPASIALMLSILLLSSLSGVMAAQTRICQEACSNLSLQEALINASPGDTIIVQSGIYRGPIIMGRPANLQGLNTGRGNPILDPEKGRVILAAQGAELSGFDFSSELAGDDGDAKDCSLEVVLPATIYLNDFPNKSSVCPGDAAAWNSSRMMNYMYNSRVQRNFLGNYWADYAGKDKNGDGIGDEPVVLDQDNIDYYPLMQPADGYKISANTVVDPDMEPIQAQVGEEFVITLPANPTTGYSWNVDYDYDLLNLSSSEYVASPTRALGAKGTSVYTFEPLQPGKTTIYFVYKRSWENIVADTKSFAVEISS